MSFASPGYPCRVSLVDAEPGETVMLLYFEHQPARWPYRAGHAIFVRENAKQALLGVGAIPDVPASRLISIRAFDTEHDMVGARVTEYSRRALPPKANVWKL